MDEKERVRREIKERRERLLAHEIEEKSLIIENKVIESDWFKGAGTVFVYMATKREVRTEEIIRAAFEEGKRVCVPVCLKEGRMKAVEIFADTTFTLNRYGIKEPVFGDSGEGEKAGATVRTDENENAVDPVEVGVASTKVGNVVDPVEVGVASTKAGNVVDPVEVDLAVVPALSCTRDGVRLGYGGGYYDRFLPLGNMKKAALCFKELLSTALPKGKYDIDMDYVVTD